MFKVIFMVIMNCLNDCFYIFQLQYVLYQKGLLFLGIIIEWLELKIFLLNYYKNGVDQFFVIEQSKLVVVLEEWFVVEFGLLVREFEEINVDDEIEDICDNKEDDLGVVEE